MGLLAKFRGGNTHKEGCSSTPHMGSSLLYHKKRTNGAMNGRFRAGSSPAREFYITLQDPHKIWKPNELICGEAVLVLKDDIANIVVCLSLVGEVRTKSGLGTTSRMRVSEQLFEKTTLIYGEEEQAVSNPNAIVNGLTKGEHRFPFRIKLPSKNIFTSISFERGSISYHVRCLLRPIDPNQQERALASCEKKVSVLVPVDVSFLPKPNTKTVVLQSPSSLKQQAPQNGEQDTSSSLTKKTTGSRNSNSTIATTGSLKTVTINVDLPSSGYVIGDIVPVKLKLEHYKDYSHSTGLIATLVRICRVCGSAKDEPLETFRKDICQTVAPIYVDHETHECCITVYLKVPLDAFPTLKMPNKQFSFQYYVEVLVNLSRKNLAFTESNRIVDTSSNSNISGTQLGSTMEETLSNLQRKLRATSGIEPMKNDDRESMILFKDLINVDKLKRLRNITGMSIEVVVGTNKSKQLSDPVITDEDQQQSQLQHLPNSEKVYMPNSTSYIFDCDDQPMLPLPQYTPNSIYGTCEDKDELERRRLQQLESEPPPEIDEPNY